MGVCEEYALHEEASMDWARALGDRDYMNRIDLLEGMNRFKAAGATHDELDAYGHGYSRAMLRSILKNADVPFEEC